MKNKFLLVWLIWVVGVFCTGCTKEPVVIPADQSLVESVAVDFSEGQRLKLKVTPGNGHGGMAIAVSGKGSIPHVTCVEDSQIFIDGNFMDLGDALESGLITVEEMDAYARLDAKNGFCQMEYASLNGLSLYVYHYDGFDIGSYYDVFEAPDGTKKHFQQLQIVTGNRYLDVEEYSVSYPYAVREDWGLSFEVMEATKDDITLQITQSGGQHFGELQIGPSLFLEKDTGGHFKEPYYQSESRLLQRKESLISNDSTTEFVIPWPWDCGELSDGEYTMHIRIEDHFDPEQIHPFTRDYTDHQIYQIDFVIGENYAEPECVEILQSPITTKAVVVRTGENEYETFETVEDVILTSAKLNRGSMVILFELAQPMDNFDCLYLNMSQFYGVPYINVDTTKNIFVTMEDGTKIEFFQPDGARTNISLVASDYIDFHNACSITLSDGTEIPVSHGK